MTQQERDIAIKLLNNMLPPFRRYASMINSDAELSGDEKYNLFIVFFFHPDWWQDKKNPERHGIRIPVMDADGNQKLDSRNRKQWKREVADATG